MKRKLATKAYAYTITRKTSTEAKRANYKHERKTHMQCTHLYYETQLAICIGKRLQNHKQNEHSHNRTQDKHANTNQQTKHTNTTHTCNLHTCNMKRSLETCKCKRKHKNTQHKHSITNRPKSRKRNTHPIYTHVQYEPQPCNKQKKTHT